MASDGFDKPFSAQAKRAGLLLIALSDGFAGTEEAGRKLALLTAQQLLAYLHGDKAEYDRLQKDGGEFIHSEIERQYGVKA